MSTEEITSIRERLARIETTVESIKACIDKHRPGYVVIPVTVVVAAIELISRFFGV